MAGVCAAAGSRAWILSRYCRVLVLPETQTMTLGLLRKIKELSDKGAVIIGGGASPQKSPSLSEMGAAMSRSRSSQANSGRKLLWEKLPPQFLASGG